MQSFKEERDFDYRLEDSTAAIKNHVNRIPVIICSNDKTSEIQYKKLLVPKNHTMGQLAHIIKKRVNIKEGEAIFIFVNNKIPRLTSLISTVYDNEKDEDGFLYVVYGIESTFGF